MPGKPILRTFKTNKNTIPWEHFGFSSFFWTQTSFSPPLVSWKVVGCFSSEATKVDREVPLKWSRLLPGGVLGLAKLGGPEGLSEMKGTWNFKSWSFLRMKRINCIFCF